MIAEILSARFKDFGAVFSEAKHRITMLTSETTNPFRVVVMVYVPSFIPASIFGHVFTAYSTLKVLLYFHSAGIFGRKPV